VEARNADYAKIVRGLQFHNAPTDKGQQQQHLSQAVDVASGGDSWQQQGSSISQTMARQQRHHSSDADGTLYSGSPNKLGGAMPGPGSSNSLHALGCAGAVGDCPGTGVRDADLLVWVGDFNYRWV
jgi:hypothetical protein